MFLGSSQSGNGLSEAQLTLPPRRNYRERQSLAAGTDRRDDVTLRSAYLMTSVSRVWRRERPCVTLEWESSERSACRGFEACAAQVGREINLLLLTHWTGAKLSLLVAVCGSCVGSRSNDVASIDRWPWRASALVLSDWVIPNVRSISTSYEVLE